MINKVSGTRIIPKIAKATADSGKGKNLMSRFLRNEALGKVLDVAAENQTVCQSLFALGICLGPRPLTNFIVTEDKQDATYASCHSISSGAVGFVWPLIFATPFAVGLKKIAKNPAKYLKAETVKKFYHDVATKEEEIVNKAGKKVKVNKVVTNEAGQMLRKDGSVIAQSLEPLMVYGKENQAAFEKNYPKFYVEAKTNVVRIKPVRTAEGGWLHIKTEKGAGKFEIKKNKTRPIGEAVQAKDFAVDNEGFIRSKSVFEMENGVEKLDANGNKIGVKIEEKELTPITEAMEISNKKEQNVHKFINMLPDTLLAPVRASLTIALIPPLLNAFGIRKSNKNKPADAANLNLVSASNNRVVSGKMGGVASTFNSFKKGGV